MSPTVAAEGGYRELKRQIHSQLSTGLQTALERTDTMLMIHTVVELELVVDP